MELGREQNVFYDVSRFVRVDMIQLNKMETIVEQKKHEILIELANQQGVKPTIEAKDLYPEKKEDFDVDEYLNQIEKIRQSDKING